MAADIENAQSLSIESFSRSWLVNLEASSGGLEDSFRAASIDASNHEASFIEMDPKLPPSKRFFRVSHDLDVGSPASHSPSMAVRAQMPLFVKPLAMESQHNSSEVMSATPVSSVKHKEVKPSGRVRRGSLRKCRRLSKQILEKYFDFLRPMCQKMQWDYRSSSRPGNNMKKAKVHRQKLKNPGYYSPANYSSPRTSSVAYSMDNWRKSCDSESSIQEAVLHCKRTIGK